MRPNLCLLRQFAALLAAALAGAAISLAESAPASPRSGDAQVRNESGPAASAATTLRQAPGRVHPALWAEATTAHPHGRTKAWVLFSDKGFPSAQARRTAIDQLKQQYNRRAIERRQARRTRAGLFDGHDLPVSRAYREAVAATGAEVRRVSRWVNGISILATAEQIEQIGRLPFVRIVQLVQRGRSIAPVDVRPPEGLGATASAAIDPFDAQYGLSLGQLDQIGIIDVHDAGFTAAGVVIGILDTGFQRTHEAFNDPTHPLTVIAEYDFIDDDANTAIEPGDPSTQHRHGTLILGTLGAYKPNELLGAAYDASFILCKTEDTTAEYPAEEDNFVAGLEFIEANGGDVATASLGYIAWYTQNDLDGMTAVTTQAVNIATANGLFCLSAAGNSGHDADPNTSHLIAPADAPQNITVGAVIDDGQTVGFSSDGPTADGRVKPEVLARGADTKTVDPDADTFYVGASGTSLSTPLVAGAVACLVQAHPQWTVDKMRSQLFSTASDYALNGEPDPLFIRGYGIIDALAALTLTDCNGNGVSDGADIAAGTSHDVDRNGVPDECQSGACCLCPSGSGCVATTLDVCDPPDAEGGFFVEGADCVDVTCPASTPANDACASGTPVTDGSLLVDSRCATDDGPDTSEGCPMSPDDTIRNDLWYHYTATCDGHLFINATTTGMFDFDPLVSVYCDGTDVCPCPGTGAIEAACGQLIADGSPETDTITVPVKAGSCYTISVGGLNADAGTVTLNVSCGYFDCASPPPQPETVVVPKNRYLSFLADAAAGAQAVRVTLVDLPPPFDVLNGQTRWVGEPVEVPENSGATTVSDPSTPTFLAAPLQCEPHVTTFSASRPVHVYGEDIVPGGQYLVQAIDAACLEQAVPGICADRAGDTWFSSPLSIATARWGDTVETCGTAPCSPPDGNLDVQDVLAVLDKFSNLAGAVTKPRADLTPALPDRRIDVSDVVATLNAFSGSTPPFAPDPTGCP